MSMLLLLALQAPELVLDARTRRAEGAYEVSLRGRLRGGPPDGSVGLQFHRVVHRAAWNEGTIETVVLEDGVARVAALSRATFAHAERFDAPGEVELRLLVEGETQPLRRTVRVGSAADVAKASATALKRIEEALASLEAVAEEAVGLCSAGGVEPRQAREARRRAERRLAAVRSAAESAGLNAAGRALSALASDVEGAITARFDGRPACRWMSSLSGRTFLLEEAGEYAEALRSLARREATLVRLRALSALHEEVTKVLSDGHVRPFERVSRSVRASLEALRELADERLSEPIDDLERLLELGSAALVCEMGAGIEWSDHAEASAERLRAIESDVRRP